MHKKKKKKKSRRNELTLSSHRPRGDSNRCFGDESSGLLERAAGGDCWRWGEASGWLIAVLDPPKSG